MRQAYPGVVECGRELAGPYATRRGDGHGKFFVACGRAWLTILVGDAKAWEAEGIPPPAWEHVSVSAQLRCPTWAEMAWVKEQFFADDECVLQYHPPKAAYVNDHPFCLHLWRPVGVAVPMPPLECV